MSYLHYSLRTDFTAWRGQHSLIDDSVVYRKATSSSSYSTGRRVLKLYGRFNYNPQRHEKFIYIMLLLNFD